MSKPTVLSRTLSAPSLFFTLCLRLALELPAWRRSPLHAETDSSSLFLALPFSVSTWQTPAWTPDGGYGDSIHSFIHSFVYSFILVEF